MAMTQTACRVCAGDLSLRVAGSNGHTPLAEAFAPSRHEPGRHGDLLACLRVRHRAAAAAAGRRRAARPLPRHARRRLPRRGGRAPRDRRAPARPDRRPRRPRPAARRRLRARPAARRGALARLRDRRARAVARGRAPRPRGARPRRARGRRSRPSTIADGFDVVVLADVLEHLDDPVAAIDRCAALLRPGGVLCVVTPDPSSLTARSPARAGGATCPPTRACSRARRCASCSPPAAWSSPTDVPLVRTFSARRWVGGLAERLGPVQPARSTAGRALPAGASLSLALRDERVILAHRIDVQRAPRAAAARTAAGRATVTSCCRPTAPRARSPTWPPRSPSTPPTARC